MRRFYCLLFSFTCLFFLLPQLASAQTTSVTLQVTDAGSQSWNNGTWSATLQTPPGVNPVGPPFFQLGTSTPVPNQSQSGALSGTGSASMTLSQNAFISPARSQWNFTVCGRTTAINNCYTQLVTITAATTVTLTPPALLVNPGLSATAYSDAEINGGNLGSQYFNVTNQGQRVCTTTAPCTWVSVSGLPSAIVSTLPSAASNTNALYQVTDAVTAGSPRRLDFFPCPRTASLGRA